MGRLLFHTRKKTTSWAVIGLDSGESCHISVAHTGVIVKRSRLGLLGRVLFRHEPLIATRVGFILSEIFPEEASALPRQLYIDHFILSTFGNALLHLHSSSEVDVVLNGIATKVRDGTLPEEVEVILNKRNQA